MIDDKKIPYIKVMKWSHNLQSLLKNGLKSPRPKKVICWSLETILLCIKEELAGGGSLAVAVTCDT